MRIASLMGISQLIRTPLKSKVGNSLYLCLILLLGFIIKRRGKQMSNSSFIIQRPFRSKFRPFDFTTMRKCTTYLKFNDLFISSAERSMEFFYLPSTERSYNFPTAEDNQVGRNAKIRPTTTKYTIVDAKNDNNQVKNSGIGGTGRNNKANLAANDEKCVPMSVDFCANLTSTTHQHSLDAHTINQLQSVVESQCYPFAAHFLCSFYIGCGNNGQRDKNGARNLVAQNTSISSKPCKDYCNEFKSHCAHQLPQEIKNKIQCGSEWSGIGSCSPKPGCVEDLYFTGQASKICDGVSQDKLSQ